MTPLCKVMNHISDLKEANSFFQRQIATRAMTLGGCIPLEILEIFQNIIKFTYIGFQTTLKIPAKVLNIVARSTALGKFEKSLSGPYQMAQTAFKVVRLTLGILSCLIVGTLFNPMANFRFHVYLDLVNDVKADAIEQKKAEEIQKRKEALTSAGLKYLENFDTAQEKKLIEIERLAKLREEQGATSITVPSTTGSLEDDFLPLSPQPPLSTIVEDGNAQPAGSPAIHQPLPSVPPPPLTPLATAIRGGRKIPSALNTNRINRQMGNGAVSTPTTTRRRLSFRTTPRGSPDANLRGFPPV